MPLQTFANEEANATVRQKLNATINAVNGITTQVTDIEEDIADLRENGVTAGPPVVPIEIEKTGNWQRSFRIFSVPSHAFTAYPSEVTVTGNGSWVTEIDLYEDNVPNGILTLDFVNLSGTVEDLYLSDFENITSVNFPMLVVTGEDFVLNGMPNLSNVSIPNLKIVGGQIRLDGANFVEELVAPNLISVQSINITDNEILTDIVFASVESVNALYISDNPVLSSIDLSSLADIEYGVEIYSNPELHTLHFDNLVRLGNIGFNYNTASLNNFRYGTTLKRVTGDQRFDSCTLTSESVDNILSRLAALDGTNGTTIYQGHSINIASDNAPFSTLEAMVGVQTLRDRNNNVDVNYPDVEFTITAGNYMGAIGYVSEGAGSVTDDGLTTPFLVRVTANGTTLELIFSGPPVLLDTLTGNKELWINGQKISGYFVTTEDENIITFEPDEGIGDPIPTFVNNQTYTIEIKNP